MPLVWHTYQLLSLEYAGTYVSQKPFSAIYNFTLVYSEIFNHICFRLVASLTLARILMTFSRRTMYFTSMILTIISLLLFSTFSYLISTSGRQERVSSLQWGSLLSSCLLVISVQLGVQTLPLLLSGELFPADVRATCKVIQQSLNV